MSFQRRIYEQNLKTESHLGPEYKYLGKDKKFGREFYEKDGQLHVTRGTSKFVQNLGSTSVKANAKMIKGLVKEEIELDEDAIDDLIARYEKSGRTAHRYRRKKRISVDGRSMSEKDAVAKMKSVLKEEIELEEAIKVGDTVHLGHGTKGGTGVVGKVTKIQGSTVHIKNDNGDTFKGPLNRATVRESVENLDEMRPHGMNLSVGNIQDTPSMQRYYAKLKAEREAKAKKPKPSDDLKGGKRPEKKLESVEHLDELKTSTIRSYVKKAQDDNQKRAMRIVDRDRLDLVHGSEMRKLRKRGLGVARAKAELDLRKITKRESVEHLDEVSPPGFEGTVKAMKKRHSDKIDNPWALAWWMKNKGYKSHKKADGTDKKEK